MKLRTALLAATVLALPVAVKAQPVSGPYVAGGVGINLMPQEHLSQTSVSVGGKTYTFGTGSDDNVSMRDGFVGLGSFGWGLGNGLRLEVEGDYRQNAYQSTAGTFVSGNEDKYGGFFNALYDFNLSSFGLNTPLVPYVGVGAGYQWATIKNGQLGPTYLNATTAPVNFTTNGQKEGSFAYQAIVGVAANIPPIPGLAVTLEYRFMGLTGNRSYTGTYNYGAGVAGARTPAGSVPGSITLNHDLNNSVLVGLRYAFNAAPPPPPPAPPPAPVPASITRNYLVFFDWDRADLTDRARQIIAEAASNSKRVQVTRIQVNGYTDTSGTAAYNQKLSVRRAQSVAAELVKDGVARGEISIQGFGETHLLVPTGPGVREPQNRRVEIILQ